MSAPRLDARLRIGGMTLDLHVAAGEVRPVDDPAVIAALIDERRAGHRVVLDGRRLDRLPLHRRVARGLGIVADATVAADVTVLDHLAALVPVGAARDLLASAPHLAGRGADPAGVLSGGERRVLAWLRCLATDPRAVVLDGAGEGLDRDALAWAGEVVATWAAAGVAVVLRPGRDEERAWVVDGG